MSTRYAESISGNDMKKPDYFTFDIVALSQLHGSFTATEIELTEEEKEQIKQSRQNIASGNSQRFGNVEEYLNSLDEDTE